MFPTLKIHWTLSIEVPSGLLSRGWESATLKKKKRRKKMRALFLDRAEIVIDLDVNYAY